MSVNEKMTAIADAIRDKTGATSLLPLDEMAAYIPRVYDKGYNGGYNEGYVSGEEDGYTTGFDSGYYEGEILGIIAGEKEENRAWWDCITNNNTRTIYDGCFRETDFNYVAGGFNPPYTLKPRYAVRLFSNARGVTKIKKGQIDTSNNQSANYMFTYCYDLVEIEEIEIGSSCLYAFGECHKLKTIGKLIIRSGISQLGANGPPFANCIALENISIEGVIPYALSLKWSPLLTNESVENVISALSDTASGQTITFNVAAKTTYFNAHSSEYVDADEAWDALCNTKPNWTISLV